MKPSSLLRLGLILIVIWVIASVTKFLAGVFLNVLLLVGILILVVWAVQKARRV